MLLGKVRSLIVVKATVTYSVSLRTAASGFVIGPRAGCGNSRPRGRYLAPIISAGVYRRPENFVKFRSTRATYIRVSRKGVTPRYRSTIAGPALYAAITRLMELRLC